MKYREHKFIRRIVNEWRIFKIMSSIRRTNFKAYKARQIVFEITVELVTWYTLAYSQYL